MTITGHLSMEDVFSHCGDGILGHIFVDGVEGFSQFIEFDDATGVEYQVTVDLAIGDPVDFAFEPLEDSYCDMTTFTSIITRANNPPP